MIGDWNERVDLSRGGIKIVTSPRSTTELQALRHIAATRPVIEPAKGMIRLLTSCGDEEAFAVLREISQHTNIKLYDVAAVVVTVGSGNPVPEQSDAAWTVLAEVQRTGLGGPFADPATDTGQL